MLAISVRSPHHLEARDIPAPERPGPGEQAELRDNSTVEIRPVEKRYIFVDGKPFGHPLEDLPTPATGSSE